MTELKGPSQLGAERLLHREQWTARIIDAIREHGGSVGDCARTLGISRRLLENWIKDIENVTGGRVERRHPGTQPGSKRKTA